MEVNMNYTIKHNDIFDSLSGIWDSSEEGIKSIPYVQEVMDENYYKMRSKLLDGGYKIFEKSR